MKFLLIALVSLSSFVNASTSETYSCSLSYSKKIDFEVVTETAKFKFDTKVKNPQGRNITVKKVRFTKSQVDAAVSITDMEHSCVDPADCANQILWRDLFVVTVHVPGQNRSYFSTNFVKNQVYFVGGFGSDSIYMSLDCKKL